MDHPWYLHIQTIDTTFPLGFTVRERILECFENNGSFCKTIRLMCTIGGLGGHIGRQSTDVSADSRPIVDRYIDRLTADASADT